MHGRELLLVGAGMQGTPYVAAARGLGARVRLIETEPHLSRLAPDVDETIAAPGTTDEDWVAATCAAVAARVPDAVLAFNEPQVIAAGLVQDEWNLPGPGLRAATISRNKALQRGRFAAAGVAQPPYLVVKDLADARDWAAARLPVVVKPLSGAGSAGVEQVSSLSDFDDAVARRSGRRLLVEEAVQGPEYSWEGLIQDAHVLLGNVTEKQTTGPPRFIEVGHRAGHRFDSQTQAAVDAMAAAVVAALGMRGGIVHLEFRLTPFGPVLIEVAVRTPGDYLMEVVSLTTGVDFYDAVVRIALGLPLDGLAAPGEPPVAYGGSWHLVAPAGRIVAVAGLDEVRAHANVVRARLRRQVGDVVAPLRSSEDRVGHVLVCAPTAPLRDEAMEFARRILCVTTQDESPTNGE